MFHTIVLLIAVLGTLSVTMGFAITSDDSGKYLAIVDNVNGIHVSSDYGAHWNVSTTYSSQNWAGLASDKSGKKLVLSTSCSNNQCASPFLSDDEGASWTQSSLSYMSSSTNVASDGSGQKLVLANTNDLYLSSNGGATWTAAGITPYPSVQAIDYSADGSTIVYSYNNFISVAKNGKWLGPTASPAAVWYSVSTDAKGTVLAGTYNTPSIYSQPYHGVYASFNAGTSYMALATSSTDLYYSVEVTDDGSLVFYGGTAGVSVYNVAKNTITRSDLPVGSTPNAYAVYAIATSKDGKYAIASSSNSNLWISSNYGINWTMVVWW